MEAIPLRVLIVEDSEDDTLLLMHELRRGGYDPFLSVLKRRKTWLPRSEKRGGTV